MGPENRRQCLPLDENAYFLTHNPQRQLVSTVFPAPNQITPYPEASSVNVSDEYYQLSRFMPRGVGTSIVAFVTC